MLKRIIGLGMLCMASHAYAANIVVTTTADEDVDDDQCSLREAVIFINLGKLNDVGENSDYHGCGGRATETENTYLPVIELEANKVYTLTQGELVINNTTTIQSSSLTDISDRSGGNNPTIQTKSPHRLFNIVDRSTSANNSIVVSFNQVDLKGCGAFGTCSFNSNGGLVLSNDSVNFTRLRMSGGRANHGGAVYLSSPLDGRVTFSEVEAFNNQAVQGSVLWMAAPRLNIEKSLIRNNTHPETARPTNDPYGYAVYVNKANAQKPDDNSGLRTGFIQTSTFYNNSERALNVVQNMAVLSNTIIGQKKGGVFFDSTGLANFANNIVAGNSNRTTRPEDGNLQNDDCIFAADIANEGTYLNHNAFEFGCDRKDIKFLDNQQKLNLLATDPSADRLIANQNDSKKEGVCDASTFKGLLCPLRRADTDFTASFKPRLSLNYVAVDESPLVNRGKTGGQSVQSFSCTTSDQRGRSRVICDIGSVELVVPSSMQTNGQDIKIGQTASFDLTDVLADGQLIPAALCPTILPNATRPDSGWQDGCLQFVTKPSKGVAFLNNDNQLIYEPRSGGFHGSDIFQYNLVTTTTRFSDAENDRLIRVETTIVSEPSGTFPDKTVSAGSVGWGALGGLMALVLFRRRMMGGKQQ
jgi:rhombotarget A family protien